MFRVQDAALLVVVFSSIAAAILLPRFAALFAAMPIYCMMALLFLNFLSIPLLALWRNLRHATRKVLYFLVIKLGVLPLAGYFAMRWALPDYALAALLMGGISTGVVSVFFAHLVQANVALFTIMVGASSLLVPFTLPVLVKATAGAELQLSLVMMIQLLTLIMFVPLLLGEGLRRLAPRLVPLVERTRYGLSLLLFAVTNLGVCSRYGEVLLQQQTLLLTALLVSIVLAALYFVIGAAVSWRMPLADQLAFILACGIMNNLLVLVFGAAFFGPIEPILAAMYTVPFFCFILPLRMYAAWRAGPRAEG